MSPTPQNVFINNVIDEERAVLFIPTSTRYCLKFDIQQADWPASDWVIPADLDFSVL